MKYYWPFGWFNKWFVAVVVCPGMGSALGQRTLSLSGVPMCTGWRAQEKFALKRA